MFELVYLLVIFLNSVKIEKTLYIIFLNLINNMAKWEPLRGCVRVDKDIEKGVYDFSKLDRGERYQPTEEEIEVYKKEQIMRGIFGVFFSTTSNGDEQGFEVKPSNNQLKFPIDKNMFYHNELEDIVKGVETRDLNDNSRVSLALDIYNSIGPAGSQVLVYMKAPFVEGHEIWEYRDLFHFYGTNYAKNNKTFIQLLKMDDKKTEDNFFKSLNFKFAFDDKRGFYVKEEEHHGTPSNPFGMIYIKSV